MFSPSHTPPNDDIPKSKISFKVVWSFPYQKKRVLVILPPVLIEAYSVLKRNPSLLQHFLHTLQSICAGEQQYIVIAFPYYDTIDPYDLEELIGFEVRPLDTLEMLYDSEFKPHIQSNVLYYLPFDDSWYQSNVLCDYFDHIIREIDLPYDWSMPLLEYEKEKDENSLIDGNNYVQERVHQIRLQRTIVFSQIPMMKMTDLDLVIVIGYIEDYEIESIKQSLYNLMKKETLYTLYLCHSNLDELYDFVLDNEPRIPNVYLKNSISKQTVRLMWENFENYNESHTFFIFLGHFDLSSESRFLWNDYAKKHLFNSLYDIYAFDSLRMQRVKGDVLTTFFPIPLLEHISKPKQINPSNDEPPDEDYEDYDEENDETFDD
jgi:hypothetical protein